MAEDHSAEPSLLPAGGDAAPAAPYRVLARKYRPTNFDDLIGQEAMVTTLSNAFDLSRIHQAYILTGVRGVGKTTTARILARAFNYEVPAQDGKAAISQPTIRMPELGVHCQAIIDSRHVDVIEMDAASHTGIDDIREIIDNARYRPVLARTKVYIIDEVHMLSKAAFNGLLKTLEEPPDHVKFIFATTEIEKVPVTVRSRCQRFDLRRIEADRLVAHLGTICTKEEIATEPEALALIARAAEGSVRDALSLLDQAIAHAKGSLRSEVKADDLRQMLGLADRTRLIDLFADVMRGDIATALNAMKALYDAGADPQRVLGELAEFTHVVTRLKLVPETAKDPALSEAERTRGSEFAQKLSLPVLTRAWQLLLKGLSEIKDSPRPLAAADMILVRLAYAADLPTPDEALRRLGPGSQNSALPVPAREPVSAGGPPPPSMARTSGAAMRAQAPQPQPQAQLAEPGLRLSRFEDVVAQAAATRDIQLKMALERDVRLVRFEEGSIEFALAPGASAQIAQTLMRRLQEWTGRRWMVAVSREAGAPSLKEQAEAATAASLHGVRADPLVRAVMDQFPGAEIVAVRETESAESPAIPEDIAYIDSTITDDDL
ncbi:MAG: DNA polymerase III subunit gamma/tau [Methylovirgula sp.]|uniref:DNA polymerase III subunit gamma/tau n=1 Tax=Methylovirgula sp. TaxID=1978224 RepID=UPI003075FF72